MTQEELRLTETEQRSRSNLKRIDKLEARQDETDRLVAAMGAMGAEQSRIKADVAEIKSDVKQLTLKPGRRWDMVAEQVLLCILTAVITMVLARIS